MRVLSKISAFLVGLIVLSSCVKIKSSNKGWNLGPTTYQYAPDSTYSRAVATKGNQVYIGNSDGFIYKLNIKSGKSKKISTQALPELRDIHVIGRNKVVAMQSAESSRMIYLKRKKEQLLSVSDKAVFLDGIDILPSGVGFMMGDPVDGYFSLYKTVDSGRNWEEIQPKLQAQTGEAGFAASGTTVQCLNDSTFIFVSGGMRSRFFKTTNQGRTWTYADLPFEKSQGSGAFSMLFINEKVGIVVGGDYMQPSKSENSSFYTTDGGKTWTASEKPTLGYRSCVVKLNNILYACGTTGIDISEDNGKTWQNHSQGNYIKLLVVNSRLFATIPKGKIVEILPFDPKRIYCG